MNYFIKQFSVDRLFDEMLEALDPDEDNGYDRDFWKVFEEHISVAGLHDRIHDEDGAVNIASRTRLPEAALQWMEKADEANEGIRHDAKSKLYGEPE